MDTFAHIWQQHGNTYRPGTTALSSRTLPAGIYRYEAVPGGWFLEHTAPKFEFPYKIYGNHEHIIDRVQRAWGSLDGNLGILLNGVKGTGKTVSAQLIANWLIEHDIPVLVVQNAIPMVEVLEKIQQPVLVIFDEFEKTHDKDEQQALLTALDGMARSRFKRMYIFTTNSKQVDENFIDRPSRIRYCWEFGRLSDDVIEGLLDDLLYPKYAHLRADIVSYLTIRQVLSIDVVKTVIAEVNLFGESPTEFAAIMNLTEQDVGGFVVEVLDDKRQVTKTLSPYFSLDKARSTQLRRILSKSGAAWFDQECGDFGGTLYIGSRANDLAIEVLEPTDDPNEWICHVQVSAEHTWYYRYRRVAPFLDNDLRWLDPQPDGWKVPSWAVKAGNNKKLTEAEEEARDEWDSTDSVYGSEERAKVLLRITPNFEGFKLSRVKLAAFGSSGSE